MTPSFTGDLNLRGSENVSLQWIKCTQLQCTTWECLYFTIYRNLIKPLYFQNNRFDIFCCVRLSKDGSKSNEEEECCPDGGILYYLFNNYYVHALLTSWVRPVVVSRSHATIDSFFLLIFYYLILIMILKQIWGWGVVVASACFKKN